MRELSGKVAVVTGGASGIGLGLARRFAAEGMKIVVADVERDALRAALATLQGDGAEVLAVHTDVSRAEEVEDMARQTFERFGAAHLLCNNAGVLTGGLSWQHDPKDWEWVFRVNLWGVIHGIRAFVPRMIAQNEDAHIVNTASIAGLVSNPYLGVYTATKHAIVALSETLCMELGTVCSRIGVSVLCPGFVATNLFESERTRPNHLTPVATERLPPAQLMVAEGLRQKIAEGMPVEEVARRAVDGIRRGEFLILTHPEHYALARLRLETLLSGAKPTFVSD